MAAGQAATTSRRSAGGGTRDCCHCLLGWGSQGPCKACPPHPGAPRAPSWGYLCCSLLQLLVWKPLLFPCHSLVHDLPAVGQDAEV